MESIQRINQLSIDTSSTPLPTPPNLQINDERDYNPVITDWAELDFNFPFDFNNHQEALNQSYEPSYASSLAESDSQFDFSDENANGPESSSNVLGTSTTTPPSSFSTELLNMLNSTSGQLALEPSQQPQQFQDPHIQPYGTRLSRYSLDMLAQLAERETLGTGVGDLMDFQSGMGVAGEGGVVGGQNPYGMGTSGGGEARYDGRGMAILGSTLTDYPPNSTAQLPPLPSSYHHDNNQTANFTGGESFNPDGNGRELRRPKGRGTLEIDRLRALVDCAQVSVASFVPTGKGEGAVSPGGPRNPLRRRRPRRVLLWGSP